MRQKDFRALAKDLLWAKDQADQQQHYGSQRGMTAEELAAENFLLRSGLWHLIHTAFTAGDDLHDVIERLRDEGRFLESDRLRQLRGALFAAAEPFHPLMPRPSRDQIARLEAAGKAGA